MEYLNSYLFRSRGSVFARDPTKSGNRCCVLFSSVWCIYWRYWFSKISNSNHSKWMISTEKWRGIYQLLTRALFVGGWPSIGALQTCPSRTLQPSNILKWKTAFVIQEYSSIMGQANGTELGLQRQILHKYQEHLHRFQPQTVWKNLNVHWRLNRLKTAYNKLSTFLFISQPFIATIDVCVLVSIVMGWHIN